MDTRVNRMANSIKEDGGELELERRKRRRQKSNLLPPKAGDLRIETDSPGTRP